LLWSAPSTSPVTIAGYNVYRGNTSAGPFAVLNGSSPLATTSFEDATVEGGTTYYYEVKSVDTNGVESPPAGPVPATTTP
jgi:fibronectin type 3 domain-containing protein